MDSAVPRQAQPRPAISSADVDGRRLSRRTVVGRGVLAAVAVVGGAALGRAEGVEAGISWCRTDPIVTVNGTSVHVYVLSTLEMYDAVTGPTEITVTYPQGTNVSARISSNDNGFGRGYRLSLRSASGLQVSGSNLQIVVEVRVGATDDSLPVRLEVVRIADGLLLAAATDHANDRFASDPFWL